MSKRLMPTYLVNFLKEIYDGTIPSNFGKRMVSRQFIARVKELYETLGGANPSDYSRRMVNEYLIKFFNEIEIVEYTDDDVKMTKTISSDLVYPACRIDAIGGMSYKSENLVALNDVEETTIAGITYKVENGVITLNGTATETTKFTFEFLNSILKDDNYYVKLFTSGTTTATNPKAIGENNTDVRMLVPPTTTFNVNYDIKYFWFSAGAGTVWTNYVIKPMIVRGSTEPSKFKAYFAGIRDIKVTAVKTYNTDNELLDTYTVPSAITSLEGYGQSNPDDPTVYNEVNFIDGKYYEKGYIVDGEWVTKVAEVNISENAPLLECVEGGTIVFENTYNQDMPNEVTTWIKES